MGHVCFYGYIPATTKHRLSLISPLSFVFFSGPWNHVGGFIFGAYVGNQYHSMEKSLVMDINQIRADKGMPPIVGSNAWIRYAEEE
jgi:hypothetical protein